MKKQKAKDSLMNAAVYDALDELGYIVEPGAEQIKRYTLGTVSVEITVRIWNEPSPESLAAYKVQAKAHVEKWPCLARECSVRVHIGGGRFSQKPEGRCRKEPGYAAMLKTGGGAVPVFVCPYHAKLRVLGADESQVLAVFSLPALAEARKKEAGSREWVR